MHENKPKLIIIPILVTAPNSSPDTIHTVLPTTCTELCNACRPGHLWMLILVLYLLTAQVTSMAFSDEERIITDKYRITQEDMQRFMNIPAES